MKKINYFEMYDEIHTTTIGFEVLLMYNKLYKTIKTRKTITEKDVKAFEYLKTMMENMEEMMEEKKRV